MNLFDLTGNKITLTLLSGSMPESQQPLNRDPDVMSILPAPVHRLGSQCQFKLIAREVLGLIG